MGQVLGPDNIPNLVKASGTELTLAATHLGRDTRITVGGQQYRVTSTLTCDLTTTGAGGLDTGSLGSSHQLYYVYAVTSNSSAALIASLSKPATGPAGFATYTLAGAFYVSDTAVIGSTVTTEGKAETEKIAFTPVWGGGTFSSSARVGYWKRSGDSMVISASATITAVTSNIFLDMLTPYPIDSNKVFNSARKDVLGVAIAVNGTDNYNYQGEVQIQNTTRVRFFGLPTPIDDIWDQARPFNWTADSGDIGCLLTVPISGWGKTIFDDA
jgi:hypothetical protein